MATLTIDIQLHPKFSFNRLSTEAPNMHTHSPPRLPQCFPPTPSSHPIVAVDSLKPLGSIA